MLALGRGSQGEAGLVVGARPAAPVTPKRADERHINRYLHASKGRESMRDDLEPAPVGQWQPEVQVAEEDVGRDPSSRLPADARRSALQGFKWQWEAQAPEEHAAEGVILQRELLARWQRRESKAAAWPSLGEQQSPRRSVKVRKERLKGSLNLRLLFLFRCCGQNKACDALASEARVSEASALPRAPPGGPPALGNATAAPGPAAG